MSSDKMLPKKICVLLCALPLVLAGPLLSEQLQEHGAPLANTRQWWERAAFYQIYPRSFKDSGDDGIGDLKGITEKLSHLKEIGITATWLSPIFKSPMADFGYDISDFRDINPDYGTLEDFDELIKKAKELDIKIILDFVPNHSSDEHEWFKKSVKKEGDYKDYYIWHPGKTDANGKRIPPNNWLSVFRGSAWKWNDDRQEYYLHQFAAGQPDLNYRNKKVQEEMADILKFWLRKGVYGFRIDAVPHVFECAEMRDEPRNNYVTDKDDWSYLVHDCTVDQNDTLEMVYQWRAVLDKYTAEESSDKLPRIMMTEAYSRLEILKQYYESTDKKKQGSQIPFNFLLITDLNKDSNAKNFETVIMKWVNNMPEGKSANWVLGNHDQHRVASRYGVEKKDIMNMIVMSLEGASVTYQGEEIGMTNGEVSWEDTKDPSGCNAGKDKYEKTSRDPERTPFHWNDEKNAGFSIAPKTWLPVASNYKEVNVRKQEGIARSTLNIYKQMQKLRQLPAYTQGGMQVKALSDNVLAIVRTTGEPETQAYVTLVNFGSKKETVSLSEFKYLSDSLTYHIVTDRSSNKLGERTSKSVELSPYAGVVLRCNVPSSA